MVGGDCGETRVEEAMTRFRHVLHTGNGGRIVLNDNVQMDAHEAAQWNVEHVATMERLWPHETEVQVRERYAALNSKLRAKYGGGR